MPTILEGHYQEIECLINDGVFIISSCLSGEIRVWNSTDCELITQIDRQKYFSSKNPSELLTTESDHHSDYESGSPPSVGEMDISMSQLKHFNRGITNDYNVGGNCTTGYNEKGVYNRKKTKSEISLKPNLNFSKLKLNEAVGNNNKNNGFDFETPFKLLTKEEGKDCIEELLNDGTSEKSDNTNSVTGNGDNCWNGLSNSNLIVDLCANEDKGTGRSNATPIWCIDCCDNVIAVGCSDGEIEFWECSTGNLLVRGKEKENFKLFFFNPEVYRKPFCVPSSVLSTMVLASESRR